MRIRAMVGLALLVFAPACTSSTVQPKETTPSADENKLDAQLVNGQTPISTNGRAR